jgi:predicted RNA-binding protein (virulence factor B family)
MGIFIGDINQLTVNRKTDIGYMLDSSEGEIFLHNNESNYQELKAGDKVDAFLYFDQKGRLAATLKTPLITTSRPGFLTVSDVIPSLGVFLHMGIAKDILLSKDDLPFNIEQWPIKGDQLYVTIKVKGKLVAKVALKEEIKLKPEQPLSVKDKVNCFVQKIGREGVNLLSKEGYQVFVHHSMIKETLRLGEEKEVKITFISEKGYTGSLIEQKEVSIYDDANRILTHIIRYGDLNLTADSTPEAIYDIFQMSKKAFKRAIGHLYKERKIVFVDGKTILVKK